MIDARTPEKQSAVSAEICHTASRQQLAMTRTVGDFSSSLVLGDDIGLRGKSQSK